MTVNARLARKALLAFDCTAESLGSAGFRFVGQPTLEIRGFIDHDPQQHVGVLRAAVLGALAEKQPGLSV